MSALVKRPRRRVDSRKRKELVKGILFVTPWLLGFLIFQVYPLFASFYYSLSSYDVLRPPVFIGLRNYTDLFQDRFFQIAVRNTLYYVVFAVPGGILVGFSLAALLNLNLKLRSVLRTIFFLPSIVPSFVSAMVWLWIFNQQYGLINAALFSMGLKGIPWLSSPAWSKPSLILISLWGSGTTMVIFLAALQDVPKELYEAARLDGAAPRHELWHITIPLVTPSVLFNLLMGMIGAFQYFTFAWIMTRGGPVRSTEFFGLYLYRNAFEYFRMGYASAMAWILFFITVTAAVIVFRTSARWVYYGGEEA
jgi:multiple sugar transport system permease protein